MIVLLIAIAAPVLAVPWGKQRGKKGSIERINVDTAFQEVYKATQRALSTSSDLKLEKIDLTFATETSTQGGFEIDLWVLSGGFSKKKSKAESATFSFGKAETKEKMVSNEDLTKFEKYLRSVITAASKIRSIDGFGLKEIEAEMEFTIERTRTVGASAEITIIPVTASGSFERSKSISHTIKVILKR